MTEGIPGARPGHDRAIQPLTMVCGTGCAVAAVALLTVMFTVHGTSVGPPERSAGGIVFTVVSAGWWLGPALCWWVRVRTLPGAAVIGLGYLGTTAWLLVLIYTSPGSTAALGFFFLPAPVWLGVLVTTDVDRAIAWWRCQRRPAPARRAVTGEGLGRWWQWLVPTGLSIATASLLWGSVWPLLAGAGWSAAGAGLAVAMRRRDPSAPV